MSNVHDGDGGESVLSAGPSASQVGTGSSVVGVLLKITSNDLDSLAAELELLPGWNRTQRIDIVHMVMNPQFF